MEDRQGRNSNMPKLPEETPAMTNQPNEARAIPHEPVAYLHTLHMEGGQIYTRLSYKEESAFGEPGKDHSEEYKVTVTPLFSTIATQPREESEPSGGEMKACPCCSSADVELRKSQTEAYVACNSCGLRTGLVWLSDDATADGQAMNAGRCNQAIAAWNARTPPDALLDKAVAASPAKDGEGRGMGCTEEDFLAAIHEKTPNGEWISVQHHPNGDWSVAAEPDAAPSLLDKAEAALREALDTVEKLIADLREDDRETHAQRIAVLEHDATEISATLDEIARERGK
jgi:hypothetical protein